MKVEQYQKDDIFKGEWAIPLPKGVESVCENGVTFTIRNDEGIIVAIFSCSCMWEGIWSVCLIPSIHIHAHPIYVSKEIKAALAALVNYHSVRKLYTLMDSSNPAFIKWIEFLGFSPEYVMKSAGPNQQDMIGYSKLITEDMLWE